MVDLITQEYLKQILFYDSPTGVFTWVIPTGDRVKAGQVAGCLRPDGYVFTQINNHRYMNHRLAWLYVEGCWPVDEIDHINGDRSDNRFSNLRPATSKQNKENTGMRSTNTSGHKGIHWDKSREKWMAFIVNNRKFHNLGRFNDLNEAIAIVKQTRNQFFTHHNTSYSS